MSKKKNLEWICRRCEKKHPEVKVGHSAEILRDCDFCGTGNWCFPVTPSRQTNTTDGLVFDEITPSEVEVEAESTEETEAIEGAVDEALEAVIEEAAEIENEPEETPVEAEPEPSEKEVTVKVKLDTTELDAALSGKEAEIAELEAKLEALKK